MNRAKRILWHGSLPALNYMFYSLPTIQTAFFLPLLFTQTIFGQSHYLVVRQAKVTGFST